MTKQILLDEALKKIPHMLGMIDKNRYSKTYGCFDRQYWHYKKFDFASGMYQLGALPLALIYKYNFNGNRWFKNPQVKELCIAAMRYMEKCSHKDGTCDEFYPYERALGATAFTLYTATESCLLLNIKDDKLIKFFKKRADWMLKNSEPGVIANHQFGVALALINVYLLTGKSKYKVGAKKKILMGLEWSNQEGWFQEYDGCDPGYHTFSIDFLAKYYKKTGDKTILPFIKSAIEFSSYFIHPDGSYGGEYGSRNTAHFCPHGFELMGPELPLALNIADQYYNGLRNGKQEYMDDDTYLFYNIINYLQAAIDYNEDRPKHVPRPSFFKHFKGAQLIVYKSKHIYGIVSLAKGGVIKVFKNRKHYLSDSGLVGVLDNNSMITTQTIDGKKNYAIFHEPGPEKHVIHIEGYFNIAKQELPTPFKQILFRCGLLSVGRFWVFGKFIKKALTWFLITGNNKTMIKFKRKITFTENDVDIVDTTINFGKRKIMNMSSGTSFSVIQVPTSRYYQDSQLEGSWVKKS